MDERLEIDLKSSDSMKPESYTSLINGVEIQTSFRVSSSQAYANKLLPAGYSAGFSIVNGLLMMEIYDGDVMVMTFPMDVSDNEEAKARITSKLKGLNDDYS